MDNRRRASVAPVNSTRALAAMLTVIGLSGGNLRAEEPPAPNPVPSVPTTPAPAPTTPTVPATPTPSDAPVSLPPPLLTTSGGTAPPSTVTPGVATETAGSDNGKKKRQTGVAGFRQQLEQMGLHVTGQAAISSVQNSVSGGPNALDQFNTSGAQYTGGGFGSSYGAQSLGPFRQNADLTITGKLFNAFDVNAHLTNQRNGNYFDQVFRFNYKHNRTSVDLGDVKASITGNELVNFSRTLQGVAATHAFNSGLGVISLSGVASLTKAVARRGEFRGQGTAGPYYLNTPSIIEGSEEVRLNDKTLERDKDYVIDYQLGQIKFLNGRIINTDDTVVYSYEAQNLNTTPGLLTGFRGALNLKSGTAIGFTLLQQKSTSGHGGNGQITTRYPVTADLTYRYELPSQIDPSSAVEVRWLDTLLAENVDYTLNRTLSYIQLRRALPPDTSTTGNVSLSIKYQPLRQSSIAGDRSVMGFDTTMQLGTAGSLGLQWGRSSAVGGSSGSAMKLSASLHSQGKSDRNRWSLNTSWNDIGVGFSTIDSTSGAFQQASKGLNTSMTFSPFKNLDFTSSLSQSRIPNNYSSTLAGTSTSTPLTYSTNNSLNLGMNLVLPNLPSLRLTHQQTTQNSGDTTTSHSIFSTDSLESNWSGGIFKVTGALTKTVSRGRSVFTNGYSNSLGDTTNTSSTLLGSVRDGTFSTTTNDSASTTSRFTLGMTPTYWLSIDSSLGLVHTQYGADSTVTTSASNTSGRDTGINILLAPKLPGSANISLRLGLTDSTNGQSTASYYNNTNTTTPSSSGILSSQTGTTLTGQRTRGTQMTLAYQPFQALSLTYNSSNSLSLIPGSDSSRNNQSALGLSLNLPHFVPINLAVSDQRVTQVGGQGDSYYKSWSLDTAFGFGKFTVRPSISQISSNASTYYGGSGVGTTGSGTTPISTRTAGLTRATSNTTSVLQAQRTLSWSTTVEYPIGGNRTVQFRWEEIDTHTPTDSGLGSGIASTTHLSNNYRRGTGTTSLVIPLNELMSFSVNFNLINLTDREDSRYSYHSRGLNMDLSAHF